MESQVSESPPIRKISNSSIQFRQLIQSLRKQNQHPITLQPEAHENGEREQDQQESSTAINSELNPSQNNNFVAPVANTSQSRLKIKPRVEVGDRDKLKKKHKNIEINPEVEQLLSKDKSQEKIELSRIKSNTASKQVLQLELSSKKNVSTQCEGFNLFESSQLFSTPRNAQRMGHIKRQVVKEQKKLEPQLSYSSNKIRNISQKIVIEYLQKQMRINEKSDPSEIFNFFASLCLSCNIIIRDPSIKKYKNCIYFGHSIEKESLYEGLLYFYDNKIYYGSFMNGYKHGLGVQVNLNENVISKGQFNEGHKTGKFYIDKPKEKYIGYMENGLYQGEGRLTTQDYVYEGLFDQGQKNGYGEEYYPKTGIRISGVFVNGVLQRSRNSKSIPEIRSKSKMTISKSKQKGTQRLQHIRRKSLEKHNQRMNKLRNTSKKQSEYEIHFDNEQYQEPPKIQVNSSKLDMYRQPIHKLPKICQQLDYSFQQGKNFQSINSHHQELAIKLQTKSKRQFVIGVPKERMGTAQLQEPLPTPCLTVYRRQR